MPESSLSDAITACWASYQQACRSASQTCTDHWVSASREQWRWLGQYLEWSLSMGELLQPRVSWGDDAATPVEPASEPNALSPSESNVIRFPAIRG